MSNVKTIVGKYSVEEFIELCTDRQKDVIAGLDFMEAYRLSENLGDEAFYIGFDLISKYEEYHSCFYKTEGFLGFLVRRMMLAPKSETGLSWEECLIDTQWCCEVMDCLDQVRLSWAAGVPLDQLPDPITVYLPTPDFEQTECISKLEWCKEPHEAAYKVIGDSSYSQVVSAKVRKADILFVDRLGKVFIKPSTCNEYGEPMAPVFDVKVEVAQAA